MTTLQETTDKLADVFTETERIGNSFTEEQFFKKPAGGKWSAAENVQHLFVSVKPLVGLFGKPELMLQFGKRTRPAMHYDAVVALYLQMLSSPAAAPVVSSNGVEGLSPTKTEQMENLRSIHAKFIERASGLSDEILDGYQIPHPLIGMLTPREWLFFTHYHEGHHTQTMAGLKS
jgi:hypothetical protein